MYKYCNEILKHSFPTPGLEPSIIWKSLSQKHFILLIWKINIYILHQKLPPKLVEMKAKTLILIHTNLVHKRFWLQFLALLKGISKNKNFQFLQIVAH